MAQRDLGEMVETKQPRAATRSASSSCQHVGCRGSRGTGRAGHPQAAQAEQWPRPLGAVKCQNRDGSRAGRVTRGARKMREEEGQNRKACGAFTATLCFLRYEPVEGLVLGRWLHCTEAGAAST